MFEASILIHARFAPEDKAGGVYQPLAGGRGVYRLERARLDARDQSASIWTRISWSNTLESLNFSAFNRFRLRAG